MAPHAQQTGWRIGFRYLAGRPLDGYARSDSTFTRRGTRALTDTGSASRWAMWPGYMRTLVRLGTPPALVLLLWLVWTFTAAALTIGAVLGTFLVVLGTFRLVGVVNDWHHRTRVVLPLHRALQTATGVAHPDPDEWLTVPRDYRQAGTDGVVMQLPDYVTPDQKKAIRDVVAQKLGLNDAEEAWRTDQRPPTVTFTPRPRPPVRVLWSDVAELARRATPTAPIVGLGARGVVVDADLEADSPHILVSAGSGGGKSVLIRTLLAQGLAHGAQAVVLDFKRISHTWTRGLPGVKYCRDIEEIHEALIGLGAEADRRNRAADDENAEVGPRIFVVAEEMNATISKLGDYWALIREKDDPKASPAVAALKDVLFMGRQIHMNVFAVAQMMTARTLGGPEARENFATRCLTRYTLNAWKMLAPEVWPAPKRSKVVGRWQIVKAGEAFETQVAFMSDDEARGWVLAGAVAAGEAVLASTIDATQGERPGTVPGGTTGLRAAAEALGVSLDSLRKAAQRDDRFPDAVGWDGPEKLYRLADLQTWHTRRTAVRLVESKGVA